MAGKGKNVKPLEDIILERDKTVRKKEKKNSTMIKGISEDMMLAFKVMEKKQVKFLFVYINNKSLYLIKIHSGNSCKQNKSY